ncbi:MAG: histidine kinase [Nocardioides sp.]
MSRPSLAVALITSAGGLPLLAALLGWDWYLDGPAVLLVALAGGYAAGAWLPRVPAAVAVVLAVAALVVANQLHEQAYHWLDDTVFYVVVVGGSAGAGAAVTLRARQVRRLERLAAELDEQQRVEVAAARLEEQNRVHQDVHTRLAERIAGIAIRAEGAQRAPDEEALEVLEAEARGVLDQLRAALGTLAPDTAVVAAEPVRPEAAPRVRTSPLDLGLAATLGVALAVETLVHSLARGPAWANVVASLLVAAPLVLRRSRPLLAVGTSLLAAVAMSAWLTPVPATVTGVALLVVAFYSVGAWCTSWWWIPGWFLAAGSALVMEEVSGLADDGTPGDPGWIVLVWMVAAVLVGRVGAGWQARVRRTADLVDELEHGRGAATRLATARTREELASELHDTVAHAMTVVCLQAGAQRRAQADAGEVLHTIATTATASLAELRDGLDAIETTERPLDASRLAALGRRVGVDVEMTEPVPAPTGPAAALAFRVVREAIVNVARHAAGSSAEVSVTRAGRALRVEVLDRGGASGPMVVGSGSGLTGLAGVVSAAGGSLTWGPRAGSGFRVLAEIPEEER